VATGAVAPWAWLHSYIAYVVVGVVAAVVTWAATFLVRRYARSAGIMEFPGERRVHLKATPTAGGAAMFIGFLAAIVVASRLSPLGPLFSRSSEPVGVVLALSVVFAVCLYDDIKEVSAPAKIAAQVLGAMVLYFFGVTMFQFKLPFAGFLVLSPGITPLLTALWVVGVANAVNLIDGLDGLAAGIVAIASAALCVYGLRLESLGVLSATNLGPLLAAIVCGLSVGFLPHNYHPAKIFMGDAGANSLGLLMAAATMLIGGRSPDVSGETYFFFAPLFIPFFILGVPLLDMAFAIVRRTARRTGVATADKDHLHHRLLRLGHGHRRAVLILWAWTAVLSGFVLYPTFDPGIDVFIPFGAAVLGVALYTLFHPALRQQGGAAQAGAGPGCEDAGQDGRMAAVPGEGFVPGEGEGDSGMLSPFPERRG